MHSKSKFDSQRNSHANQLLPFRCSRCHLDSPASRQVRWPLHSIGNDCPILRAVWYLTSSSPNRATARELGRKKKPLTRLFYHSLMTLFLCKYLMFINMSMLWIVHALSQAASVTTVIDLRSSVPAMGLRAVSLTMLWIWKILRASFSNLNLFCPNRPWLGLCFCV